jgi:hypothetical protein
MGAEGTVAIVAGLLAGSIALVGFGIDRGRRPPFVTEAPGYRRAQRPPAHPSA